jgi:hypothetical protein
MRCITDTRYPKRMFDTVASSIWAFVCWCWQLPPGSCKTKWNGGYTSNALGWPKLGGYTLGKVVYFVGGHSGMSEFLRRPRLRWHLFVNMTKLDDRFAQASTCPSRRLSLCLRKISDSPSEMRGLVFGTFWKKSFCPSSAQQLISHLRCLSLACCLSCHHHPNSVTLTHAVLCCKRNNYNKPRWMTFS